MTRRCANQPKVPHQKGPQSQSRGRYDADWGSPVQGPKAATLECVSGRKAVRTLVGSSAHLRQASPYEPFRALVGWSLCPPWRCSRPPKWESKSQKAERGAPTLVPAACATLNTIVSPSRVPLPAPSRSLFSSSHQLLRVTVQESPHTCLQLPTVCREQRLGRQRVRPQGA